MGPRKRDEPVAWKGVVSVDDLYHLSVLLIMVVAAISQSPSPGDVDHAIIPYDLDECACGGLSRMCACLGSLGQVKISSQGLHGSRYAFLSLNLIV